MVRVRAKVPDVQLLHVNSFLLAQRISQRLWAEMLLTYLCCPKHEHPLIAQMGVTCPQLLKAAQVDNLEGSELALWQYRWPASLIPLVDPGLELAELSLPGFLGVLWDWALSPELQVQASAAARLAAFASHFAEQPRGWNELYATHRGSYLAGAHDFVDIPFYRCERLPWVPHIRGLHIPKEDK